MEMYRRAVDFATKALQNRKSDDGRPYVEHALRIADQMDTEEEKVVAVLHDVLEDTEMQAYDLRDAGFPESIVMMVDQMTRHNDTTYFDYIEDVATNPVTKKVKLAELQDNKDIFRVRKLSFQTFPIDVRVERARKVLLNS